MTSLKKEYFLDWFTTIYEEIEYENKFLKLPLFRELF